MRLGFACFLMLTLGGPVCAGEYLDSRPDLDFLNQTPLVSKMVYREMWQQENARGVSESGQLEYVMRHNPGLDADTMVIVRRGQAAMQKMDFGLKDKDVAQKAAALKNDPRGTLQGLSAAKRISATPTDALAAEDTIEPAKRLNEKINSDKSWGQYNHNIDIYAF